MIPIMENERKKWKRNGSWLYMIVYERFGGQGLGTAWRVGVT